MNRHPDPARKSVLYVEDHPVNVMLMSALMARRPELELVVAHDGQQAMCIAANLHPALILLDLRLPDCHGSQLLPLLRLLPGCEHVPAVAVTAEDDFRLEGSGFIELWSKPLDLASVLQRLGALTTARSASTPHAGEPRVDADAESAPRRATPTAAEAACAGARDPAVC